MLCSFTVHRALQCTGCTAQQAWNEPVNLKFLTSLIYKFNHLVLSNPHVNTEVICLEYILSFTTENIKYDTMYGFKHVWVSLNLDWNKFF